MNNKIMPGDLGYLPPELRPDKYPRNSCMEKEIQQLRKENERVTLLMETNRRQFDNCFEKLQEAKEQIEKLKDDNLNEQTDIAQEWRSIVADHVIKNGFLEKEVENRNNEIRDLKNILDNVTPNDVFWEQFDRLSREAAEMKLCLKLAYQNLPEFNEEVDPINQIYLTEIRQQINACLSTSAGAGYVKREEVQPLLDVLEKVSKWGGCNGFDNPGMGSGLPCVWKGCYAYHSDDPNEYCLPCEANNALINFAQAELERTKTTEKL